MKKVYTLLGVWEDGNYSIIGVFSSHKKAVEIENRREQGRFNCTQIIPMVVDEYKEL